MNNLGIHLLIEQHKFNRARLIFLINEINNSNHFESAFYWKLPFGENGRAHIAWQVLHCAATLDKYLNIRLLNIEPKDPTFVKMYGSGSKPDSNIKHSLDYILEKLDETSNHYFEYFLKLEEKSLNEKPKSGFEKTHKEILLLLNWHEAEHTGQCQIIWNSYKTLHFPQ
jgi:hypothetical protein